MMSSDGRLTIVQSKTAKTASIDLARRVITIPSWDVSPEILDLFISHEVSHAINTDPKKWVEYQKEIVKKTKVSSLVVNDYFQILEDVRINNFIKRMYPGTKKDFNIGGAELMSLEFFSARVGFSYNTKKKLLIELILFKDKIGEKNIRLEFSDEELDIVNRVWKMRTMEDVRDRAIEMILREKKLTKKRKKQNPLPSLPSEKFDGESTEPESTEPDFPSDGAGPSDTEEDDEEPESTEPDSTEPDLPSMSEPSDGAGPSDTEEDEEDDEDVELDRPEEMSIFNDQLESTINQSSTQNRKFYRVPSIKSDWEKCIVDDGFMEHVNGCPELSNSKSAVFEKWKKTETHIVNYMVKEFTAKQAARSWVNSKISQKGTLNTKKLHNYKHSDKIFNTKRVFKKGKNHGFVMILDWSSSMSSILKSVLEKSISLAMFCRQLRIPFEIYTFNSKRGGYPFSEKEADDMFNIDQGAKFQLWKILSSDMKIEDFNKACEVVYTMGANSAYRHTKLSSTPLLGSTLISQNIMQRFQNRNSTEVNNLIFITDGCATDSLRNSEGAVLKNFVTYDPETNYMLNNKSIRTENDLILLHLKERLKNVNLIHIDLVKDLNYLPIEKKALATEDFIVLDSVGYDIEFVVSPRIHITSHSDKIFDKLKKERIFIRQYVDYISDLI